MKDNLSTSLILDIETLLLYKSIPCSTFSPIIVIYITFIYVTIQNISIYVIQGLLKRQVYVFTNFAVVNLFVISFFHFISSSVHWYPLIQKRLIPTSCFCVVTQIHYISISYRPNNTNINVYASSIQVS